jgi:GTP-binding protein
MRVVEVEFLTSGADPEAGAGWPAPGPHEIGFVGRSNVGKSTLLEGLLGRKGMVRISKTPGRTRLINFFRVVVEAEKGKQQTELRLVDLPGFGYAKVSKSARAEWLPWMTRYLGERPSLRACVLLVDARRGPELDETELASWLRGRGVDVIPVMTKADKLSKHERIPCAESMREALGKTPIIVSATDKLGLDELWRRLVAAARAIG